MKKMTALLFVAAGFYANAIEQLPIIQTKYNADPAPMVHNLSLIHI